MTRIIPGKIQEVAFKKGQVIREEDIPELLKLGKEHVWVWQMTPGMMHEDEAATQIARAAAGGGIELTSPAEGKVELKAAHPGLFQVNRQALRTVNSVSQVTLVTRRNHDPVYNRGEVVASSRVIPLVIEAKRVEEAVAVCRELGGILEVIPFTVRRVGVVITGNEVYHGRIEDGFGPVLKDKFAQLGCHVLDVRYAPDHPQQIAKHITALRDEGAELIAATGGMSVDPDDRTPGAIKAAGAHIVSYGIPMLPGNMFLVGYLDDVPVVGLPGCVMFQEKTAFDVLVPRLLAGIRLTKEDIVDLGYGGLLSHC